MKYYFENIIFSFELDKKHLKVRDKFCESKGIKDTKL